MGKRYDVLVAGGGMAGCSAALAAAREGAKVLLVEQGSYLGGNATRAMVGPWQSFHASVTHDDARLPQQVIGGIAQEFVDDLVELGGSTGHVVDPIGFAGSITPVDSEMLKLYLFLKIYGSDIEVLLATGLTQAHLNSAEQVVDATGCSAAARMMGAKTVTPADPQPLSWLFTVTGVDLKIVREYQESHPDQFVLHPAFSQLQRASTNLAVSGYFDLVNEARANGELAVPRDRLLFFSTPRPGEVLVNTTRIAADHPSPRLEGQRQIDNLVAWLPQRIPGFEQAKLGRIADDIGQRESSRIVGKETLTVKQIIAGDTPGSTVVHGCYPIDIHSADSASLFTRKLNPVGYYGIPLGCLESVNVPNLLCAGRCISADRQGFASARVLPTAIATGQAAGMLSACRALGKVFDNSSCLSSISLV